MTEGQHPKYDPHSAISTEDLANIIKSHDRLKLWNDLNEHALANQPDEHVVKNIQSTAALIVLNEMPVSSQNFELMRAMNLFDRTLSTKNVVIGAMDGIGSKLTDVVKDKFTIPQPESMNLERAQERGHSLIEAPGKLASTIYTAANIAWQNPAIVSTAIRQTASNGITKIRINLAESMIAGNPSYAVGVALGASVTDLTISTWDPAKKLDWSNYAHTLGNGIVLPPTKPLRDFSGEMKISQTKWGSPRVNYEPANQHLIDSSIDEVLGLSYKIEAKNSRADYGSGSEMFLSSAKLYHQNNIEITKLSAFWEPGKLGSNHSQFLDALQNGATLEQAATRTFTGKMAGKLGLTSVDTSQLEEAAKKGDFSVLMPTFSHPDWGDGELMNNYSRAYALAHGRADLELIPKTAIPEGMLAEIKKLPEEQQSSVLRHVSKNFQAQEFDKPVADSHNSSIDP